MTLSSVGGGGSPHCDLEGYSTGRNLQPLGPDPRWKENPGLRSHSSQRLLTCSGSQFR